MKAIKFRGKEAETGKWMYGDLFQRTGFYPSIITSHIKDDGKIGYAENAAIQDTIGQFTGLCDKNGKEIYEGDILHYVEEIGEKEYHYYREVVFHGGAFCQIIPLSSINAYKPLFFISLDRWDLAGNIHDNPELMEGGEKK